MYTLPKDKRSYKYYYGVEDLGAENSEKEMWVCGYVVLFCPSGFQHIMWVTLYGAFKEDWER